MSVIDSGSGPADGAILGASVRTLDPQQPAVSALAWRDGELVAVGADDEVRAHVGPATEVIDGRGLTVTPGLVDSHLHPFVGTLRTRGLDLRSAETLDEVRRRLAAERERVGPGGWVLGHSMRYEPWHASGLRADAVADVLGETPALLTFYDDHTSIANDPALRRAGIDGPREFAEYSVIECDPDGTPTGALLESAAIGLVRDVIPALTPEEQLAAYAQTLRALNRVGLTGAHAMLGGPELVEICHTLEERGELRVRLLLPLHQEPAIEDDEVERRLPLAGVGGRRWRVGTAKFFLDGVLDSGTAWLTDPGPEGANAKAFWPSVERYAELVRRFTAAGFATATHAVGDGAVQAALDAYELAGPPRRGMHRVEHIETLNDADLPRFAELGVAASMQPLHMEGLDDPTTPSLWSDGLSAGRLERGFRCADLAGSGAVLALGSDWMVADYDPRVGIAWAVLRRKPGRPERVPYLPAQALTAEHALLGYTAHAAAAAGATQEYGRLRPGMRADVTAFAEDPCAVAADELPDVPVRLTVVDGEVVHRDEG